MKFSRYQYKVVAFCHGLVSKAEFLLFKQDYDSVRSCRQNCAVCSGTAQSGGINTEINVRFTPPPMCRRTAYVVGQV
jgi:hypothetical protein